MRSAKLLAAILTALLATTIQTAAQHTRYRLIDIGTLGGPSAHGPGNGIGSQLLNNAGTVIGTADTSVLDPNCGCPIDHGFQWKDGVLTDLGSLSGVNTSAANSINARGWIAGFSITDEIDPITGNRAGHAVLWKNGGIVDLGTLGTGVDSAAVYVNNAGTVVGLSTVDTTFDPFASFGPFSSPTHAFVLNKGVTRDLGTLGGPDSFPSLSCNNQRSDLVVGESYVSTTPNSDTGVPTLDPFLWHNGAMTDLGTLGGTFGVSQCANARGQVVGQSSLTGGSCATGAGACHATLWDGSTLNDLGTLGGTFSVPFWLNDNGDAVGGSTTRDDEFFHATQWRNGTITDLGTLPGDCFSIAFAINSKGQAVGQSFSCDGSVSRGVLWSNGSAIDLNMDLREEDINDRGEITGIGLFDGCDDQDACGHAVVLIPCDASSCSNADSSAVAPQNNALKKAPSADRAPKQIVAAWRTRLAQRYPGFARKD